MKQLNTTIDYLRVIAEEKYGILEYDTEYDINEYDLKINTPDGISAITHFVKKMGELMIVKLSDGSVVKAADKHIIVTPTGCRKLSQLKIGDLISTSNGEIEVTNIQTTGESQEFFDITVDNDSHTYYDGNGVAHHNTYTLEKVLHAAGKTDGNGYFKISGSGSPIGLYKALYQNRNGIVLADDCDTLLDQQEARNLIKAATDTKKERKLNWMKKGGKEFYDPSNESDGDEDGEGDDEKFPTNFIFTGKFIMISNLPLNKLDPDGALRTRSFIVNIDPTDLELVDYMAKLAPSIQLEDGLTLTLSERQEVTDLIKSMVGKRKGLSLRNLVRGLNIRASGIPDWKNIIIRYA